MGQVATSTTTTTTNKKDPTMWGMPGHLTMEEANVYLQLKAELDKRGHGDFRDTIFGFGEEEGEVYALCRYLRHSKFVYEHTIDCIEQGIQIRQEAKQANFYPILNTSNVLNCDPILYYLQFPQLYTGTLDKSGIPIFISKPGQMNVDGIDLLTTYDGIIKLHWNLMVHDLGTRLRHEKNKQPKQFKRYVTRGKNYN